MPNFIKQIIKSPTWQKLAIILLFLISICSIFWPVLFGNKIFSHNFPLNVHYPAYYFFAKSFETHTSPLWLSGILGGFPIYVSQIGFLYPLFLSPLNFVFKIFNFLTVYHCLIFIGFFLGALATYLLARNLSLSKTASLIVAFTFVFTQCNLFLGQLDGFAILLLILPLLFLSILKISKGKKYYILIGTGILLLGWLSAHIENMLYVAVAGFFFAIFLDILNYNRQERLLKNLRALKGLLIILILSGVFILPFLLPSTQFVSFTSRAEGITTSELTSAYLNLGNLPHFFYPYFSIPFFFSWEQVQVYIAIVSLFLVIISFLTVKKNKFIKFFIFLFLFSLLATFKYPLFWLMHKLPVFNLFRGAIRWLFISNFSLAILAGFGLDNLKNISERLSFKKLVRVLKVLAILVLSLMIIINLAFTVLRPKITTFAQNYFNKHLYNQTTKRPLVHYYELINQAIDQFSGNISLINYHFLIALLFFLVPILLFYLYQKRKIATSKLKALFLVAVILNVLLMWQGYYKFLPRGMITSPPDTVKFLQEQKQQNPQEPFRVFRFFPGLSPVMDLGLDAENLESDIEYKLSNLNPNSNIFFDIDVVDGMENFMTRRQTEILTLIGSDRMPTQERLASLKIPLEDKLKIFNSHRNLLSMMNVRYVISSFEFPSPWKKVFETMITKDNVPVYIYENPDALPRIYFANNIIFIEPNENKALDALLQIEDFKKDTLIECLGCQNQESRIGNQDNAEITIEEIKNGYLKLKTISNSSRWLIYSESNLPTWETRINGNPTEIYTANYLLQAILVPAGEHEIEFKYPGLFSQISYSLKEIISK